MDKEKNELNQQIISALSKVLPKMTESEKMFLLGYARGMALSKQQQKKEKEKEVE
ncbi:hypothetical protein M2145_002570 [Lachnospiraceae bacterium PF1-21]